MQDTQTDQTRGDILIVDDTLPNLRLLSNMLSEQGYEARGVPDGQMALDVANLEPPDLPPVLIETDPRSAEFLSGISDTVHHQPFAAEILGSDCGRPPALTGADPWIPSAGRPFPQS